MNSNDTFLQLLDEARLKTGKKLKEIALAIDCHPTYLSRIRTGKQNAGPSVTMALQRFLEHEEKPKEPIATPPQSRGVEALQRTAIKFGIDADELLESLVMKHGWSEAQAMKSEQSSAVISPAVTVTTKQVETAQSKMLRIALQRTSAKR